MKHEYYEILVSRMIDNDVDENEINIIEEHIQKCSKCKKLKSEFESLSKFMHEETDKYTVRNTSHLFSNAIKIAAIFVFVVALGGVFVNLNYQKTDPINTPVALVDNYSYTENISVDSMDEQVFKTFDSYTNEYSTDEIDVSPLSTYFSYLDMNE